MQSNYTLRDQQPEIDSPSVSEKYGEHQSLTATLHTCRQYLIDTFCYENIGKLVQATKNGIKSLPETLSKACKFIIKVLHMPETWVTVAVVAIANSIVFSIPAVAMQSVNCMLIDGLSSLTGSSILVQAICYMEQRYGHQNMIKSSWITANTMKAVTTSSLLHTTLLLLHSIFMNDGSQERLGYFALRCLSLIFSICSWLFVTILCAITKSIGN